MNEIQSAKALTFVVMTDMRNKIQDQLEEEKVKRNAARVEELSWQIRTLDEWIESRRNPRG